MEETDTEQPLRNDNQEDTDDWQSATDNPVDTQVESETWSSKATKPWGAMWTCAPPPSHFFKVKNVPFFLGYSAHLKNEQSIY